MTVEFIIAHYHEGKNNKIKKDVHFTQIILLNRLCQVLSAVFLSGVRYFRTIALHRPSLKFSVVDVVPERLYETFNGMDEAGYGTYAPNDENGNVEEDVVPHEVSPLEL